MLKNVFSKCALPLQTARENTQQILRQFKKQSWMLAYVFMLMMFAQSMFAANPFGDITNTAQNAVTAIYFVSCCGCVVLFVMCIFSFRGGRYMEAITEAAGIAVGLFIIYNAKTWVNNNTGANIQ